MTVFALYFHASGIVFIALLRTVNQAFYARKDLKTPAIVASIDMVLHFILCITLSKPLKHGGIALAGSISAFINFSALLYLLRRSFGPLDLRKTYIPIVKITISSLIILVIAYILSQYLGLDQQISRLSLAIKLSVVIIVAMVVYYFATLMLGTPQAHQIVAVLRRKRIN